MLPKLPHSGVMSTKTRYGMTLNRSSELWWQCLVSRNYPWISTLLTDLKLNIYINNNIIFLKEECIACIVKSYYPLFFTCLTIIHEWFIERVSYMWVRRVIFKVQYTNYKYISLLYWTVLNKKWVTQIIIK